MGGGYDSGPKLVGLMLENIGEIADEWELKIINPISIYSRPKNLKAEPCIKGIAWVILHAKIDATLDPNIDALHFPHPIPPGILIRYHNPVRPYNSHSITLLF